MGFCPPKLQLDPRIRDFVAAYGAPYAAVDPRNTQLAGEVMRQMNIDFVVATRAESLALEATLQSLGRTMPHWHIVTALPEKDLPMPAGAVRDPHEHPGKPYEY